jgi:YD repeat-containing protein
MDGYHDVTSTDRRSLTTYDARGRVTHSEDQINQVAIPETVKDFVYDQGVNNLTPPVTATNTLGRLAKATAPTSSVSFSYDAFGQINAQVFTDRTATSNNVYVEKRDYHGDGSLQALHLLCPTRLQDEVDYTTTRPAARVRSNTPTGRAAWPCRCSTSTPLIRLVHSEGELACRHSMARRPLATYAETGRHLLQDEGHFGDRCVAGDFHQPVAGTTGSVSAFDPWV